MLAVAARSFQPLEKCARFTYRLKAMMHAGETFHARVDKARKLTWDDLEAEVKAEEKDAEGESGGKDTTSGVTATRFLRHAERDGDDGFVVKGERHEVWRRMVWIEGLNGEVRASGELDSVKKLGRRKSDARGEMEGSAVESEKATQGSDPDPQVKPPRD
jgi:hypothetical protein